MKKNILVLFVMFLSFVFLWHANAAEKQISVFYPSPYGEYIELRNESMVVGTGNYMDRTAVDAQNGVILVENGLAITAGTTGSNYLQAKNVIARLRVDANNGNNGLVYSSQGQLLVGDMNSVGSYNNAKVLITDATTSIAAGQVVGVGNFTNAKGVDVNTALGGIFIGEGSGPHLGVAIDGGGNNAGFVVHSGNATGGLTVLGGTSSPVLWIQGTDPTLSFSSSGSWHRDTTPPAAIAYSSNNDVLVIHGNKIDFNDLDGGSFMVHMGNGNIAAFTGGGNSIVMDNNANLFLNGGNEVLTKGNLSLQQGDMVLGNGDINVSSGSVFISGVLAVGSSTVGSEAGKTLRANISGNIAVDDIYIRRLGKWLGDLHPLTECRVRVFSATRDGTGRFSAYSSNNKEKCTDYRTIYHTHGKSGVGVCIQCR